MGACCYKPAKRRMYGPIEPYFAITPDDDQLALSDSSSDIDVSKRRVLPYAEACQAIEDNHCYICTDTTIADQDVYAEWTDRKTDEQLLEAPEGVYGSLCQCDPGKTLCHLACAKELFVSMSNNPDLRRTCGFCGEPWSLIRSEKPGMSIALELLEQRNPNTPAWKWKDIPAGDYWVRIQAGPGAASLPEDLDIDLPDAYTAVQVELFDQFGRRVNAQQILSKLSVRRSFTSQGVGKFISWQDLRSVLNFLESTTLF